MPEKPIRICSEEQPPFNPNLPSVELIVEHYRAPDTVRQQEIDFCLRQNVENPFIDRVHIMALEPVDLGKWPIGRAKVRQVEREARLTFAECFDYVRAEVSEGVICIIANADIFFDDTLSLLKLQEMEARAFALLRYEYLEDGSIELHGTNPRAPTYHPNILRGGSQDSWIFRTPLPPIEDRAAFFVGGVHLCDSKINWILHNAGLKVTNPCYSLRSIHYHRSQTRHTIRDPQCSEPPFYCPSPCHLPNRFELLRGE